MMGTARALHMQYHSPVPSSVFKLLEPRSRLRRLLPLILEALSIASLIALMID
jgi:hypothetical protein